MAEQDRITKDLDAMVSVLLDDFRDREVPERAEGDKWPLRPCPFCGGWPHIAARKIVIIDGISGKARYSRKQWFIEPGCKPGCFLYSLHVRAFPAVGGTNGLGFDTRQAAIDAWNKRGGKET